MSRTSQTPSGKIYDHILDKPLQDNSKKDGFIMITPDLKIHYLNMTLQLNSFGNPVKPVRHANRTKHGNWYPLNR
jgi:hypothetical protein